VTSVIMAVTSRSWSQIEVTGLVQRTHVQVVPESVGSAVSRLLDLPGLAVRDVATDRHGGRVVHVVTADLGASACPSCGELSTSTKGQVTTAPRDIPYGPTPVALVWHKRRWRCTDPRCARGSFTEAVSAAPARSRLTVRLRAELAAAVADQHRCVAEAAAYYGVGWATVHNAFKSRVDAPLAGPLPGVTVLGIDETRRGKPVWTREAGTGRWVLTHDRWHTGFVDSAGTGGLLAQVEGRSAAVVSTWLLAQPAPWREAITHVTIDLSASFAKGVRDGLPHATLVADRFHIVALANQTVTVVRQRVVREHEGRRGRKVDPAWRVRRRLLTGHENLRPETFVAMWNALIDTGDPGVEILGAYVVKEDLRALLALAGNHPDRRAISGALLSFYEHAAASTAPEVHRLAATVERWWPAILAGLESGYSNSRSEGYNRLAKHEGRNAFGFRNPINQRRRIRWACTRQHRRETAKNTDLPG
jgi:transposase